MAIPPPNSLHGDSSAAPTPSEEPRIPWASNGVADTAVTREASEVPQVSETAEGIRFNAVTKTYGNRRSTSTVLRELSLDIPAGQITVFVGPSGCGKSTSLRMINRMVEPNSGSVTIDAVDVRERNPYELRRGIGYVMQQGGLMPHRTVAQNIATVPRLLGASRKEAQTRALELLEVVGLDSSYAKRYPAQLSGGQVQRVGVARALAADAPILLMDEPFSAVDPIVRTELQRELLRLQARLGKTIVFVTHDIDEALLLGDRIAVFAAGGRLAQHGTPEEILYSPADDFVRSFVSRSVAGLLDERTVRRARARRLEGMRNEAREQAPKGVDNE
ncbi:ABC transporter ATP-binding protein [uncultured Rothia sp.]|uniref:ABC transporter ATP-binding protein n=1 Tax=uncultured Rothia sp. TaxID=316088 RepID=UPI0025CC6581|nr:ABC transporter ATP-binding protein [uncultured Rothia sp.]